MADNNQQSSNEDESEFFPDISIEEFNRWYEKTALNRDCEVCGSDNWITFSGYKEGFALVQLVKPPEGHPTGYDVALITRTCISCGNTKFFNRYLVQYEMKRFRKSQSEEQGGA